jgi:hypothetical protein
MAITTYTWDTGRGYNAAGEHIITITVIGVCEDDDFWADANFDDQTRMIKGKVRIFANDLANCYTLREAVLREYDAMRYTAI